MSGLINKSLRTLCGNSECAVPTSEAREGRLGRGRPRFSRCQEQTPNQGREYERRLDVRELLTEQVLSEAPVLPCPQLPGLAPNPVCLQFQRQGVQEGEAGGL